MSQIPLLTLPLHGRQLLEASAGTGKTWTIGGLFVRLLLEGACKVDQILVVTFTNAATSELKERIRARLREVLELLEGGGPGSDPLLEFLDAMYAGAGERRRARLCLRRALASFDDAAIYTIHGFCQRILNEYPFHCRLRGDEELGAGLDDLRRTAFDDYWRLFCADASADGLELLCAIGASADALADRAMRQALSAGEDELLPAGADFAALTADWAHIRAELRTLWASDRALIADIQQHANLQPSARQKGADRIEQLDAWLMADGPLPDKLSESGAAWLAGKCSKVKGVAKPLPEHPFMQLVDQAVALQAQVRPVLYGHALAWARQRFRALKQTAGALGYEDLLTRLQEALVGQGGTGFARLLRTRFPAALIDEFQDTDPVQYAIFDAIYAGGDNLLAFVGDPKQAIYAFRGGDIFTYMRARDSVAAADTLRANFRSTPAMIGAVNSLFDPGVHPRPFFYPEIVYEMVAPGRDDHLPLRDPATDAAMLVWQLPGEAGGLWAKPDAVAACVDATVVEISRLLNQARLGERRLAPADIVVLVLNHVQGRQVQHALQAAAIPCVRSGQDNVLDGPEADALSIVLHAIAVPRRADWIRAALGSSLIGLDAAALAALDEDDGQWTGYCERFRALHEDWQRSGFLAMFDRFLCGFAVIERLLSLAEGERAVTNLLQLGELLQAASVQEDLQPERLLDWFAARRRDSAEVDADEYQLRLESDAERVRILTVHKSKGLEFNICFAPFLFQRGAVKRETPQVYHRLDEQRAVVRDFQPGPEAAALAAQEHLAEGLRLVYVALTRSVYRCYLAWGACNGAWQSPLAWLLQGAGHQAGDDPLTACRNAVQADMQADSAATAAALQAWQGRASGAVAVTALPQGSPLPVTFTQAGSGPLQARSFDRRLARGWLLSSYSRIAAGADPERPDYDGHAAPAEAGGAPVSSILALPGGVHFGTAVHKIFEHLRPEEGQQDRDALIRTQLRRYLQLDAQQEPVWLAAIRAMLDEVLSTPLAEAGIALGQMQAGQYLNEMGFSCSLQGFSGERLAGLLGEYEAYRAAGFDVAARRLPGSHLKSYLNGEIDLCLEVDGRYFIIDWKTNTLGSTRAAYGAQGMQECIRSHHYYLQYLLYALAMHRHLRCCLTDYHYDRHFGGVYYLFVRGMRRDDQQGIYFDRPPLALIEQLDRIASGQGVYQ